MSESIDNIGAQIERLTLAAVGKTVEIDGRSYATAPLHDPRKPEPTPPTLKVASLRSLTDYLHSAIDDDYRAPRAEFLHVAGPDSVSLYTGIFGQFHQRVALMTAEAVVPRFPFGQFMDPEEFNTALLAQFVETPDRADVLKITGNLTTEAVQTVADDGVTQQVTARAGIQRRAEVEIKTIRTLRPYRTFAEVEQPASPFVLRLRSNGVGTLPKCALFEADGGRWRLDAIAAVKAWLMDSVQKITVGVYG